MSAKFRTEKDSLGTLQVPADAYYGVQAARAVANFPISGMRAHPALILAYVQIKRAAAVTNLKLGMLDKPRADAIIKAYFEQYPKVKAFMDRTIEQCRQAGFVETKTGRRRIIHDIGSRNATLRNAAERTAINSPIQGTAADMIKLAMRDIARAFSEQNFQSRMLLQVHDELVFDLDREEADAVCAVVDSCMKHALPLRVPVVVDMGRGPDWLAAHG